MKAAVLPEPVTALAHRSSPLTACGITAAWIGVGLANPSSATALISGRESCSSSKLVACADCRPAATAWSSSSSSAVAPPLLPAPLLFFSCASCSSACRAFRSRATLPVLASTSALAVSAGLVGGCCSASVLPSLLPSLLPSVLPSERRFSCASSVLLLDADAAEARRPLCAASVFQPSAR